LQPMPDAKRAALDAARTGAGPPGSVVVERYGIKRSLAWELAGRRIRETERAKAKKLVLASHKCQARPTHWFPYDRVGVVNTDP